MLKTIEKPKYYEINAEKIIELLQNKKAFEIIQKSLSPYAYWDKVKYWPLPKGITNLELWAVIKVFRNKIIARKTSIIKDERGHNFTWTPWLPKLEQLLHEVDMRLGGNLFSPVKQIGAEFQHHLLTRGIMEEAIASSQLEGAHTSRKAAKQILLEGRKPRNKDEQMIVNNYQAMKLIETDLKNKNLDEAVFFLLHKTLTKNTLPEEEIGRYRKDTDNIVVGGLKGEIYFVPPKEDFVKKEISKLFAYANNELIDDNFVHPIIKAIIIHFWIGFLHPFVDGNGRMARALFYWYLLREKYWAFGFIPLSKVIKNSPIQYRDAYIYSEQDDNDLTYFIDYNINKITQAMHEFESYAARKWTENTKMAKVARNKFQLNDRQIQLLRYYYKNKDATTSVATHAKVYEASRITAMKDLRSLQQQGFLQAKKVGRIVYYYATDKILELFE